MNYSDNLIKFINKYHDIYRIFILISDWIFVALGLMVVFVSFHYVYVKFKKEKRHYHIPNLVTVLTTFLLIIFIASKSITYGISASFDRSSNNINKSFLSTVTQLSKEVGDHSDLIESEQMKFDSDMDEVIFVLESSHLKNKLDFFKRNRTATYVQSQNIKNSTDE